MAKPSFIGLAPNATSYPETNATPSASFGPGANSQVDVPCFAKGTLILTPRGEVKIEDLKSGDLVTMADDTERPIEWVGSKTVKTDPESCERLNPIQISIGALAPNVPSVPLRVSPNHRVLVSRPENKIHFGESSVLVPAKHLTSMDGVTQDDTPQQVTYYHLLFKRHEIVISNGAETESFHPSDAAFNSLAEQSREEILALFPELRDRSKNAYGDTAARAVQDHEVDQLNFS